MTGTDPNGKNLSAEHAALVARNVAEAIEVPLIVWGVSSDEKNTVVLKAVAESCAGFNVVLGPITESNYKQVGAAAIAYKHTVVANTPIDVNLAKQLNILLENLGVPNDRILIDPTTGGVGYGLEYSYSIMERIRQAALTQNDEKLQYPILNNIAEEVWKTKEAKILQEEVPLLGNPAMRGINLEAITALSALQAGSDILVLRHPKSLWHIRRYISDMMVTTDLDSMSVDLSLATVTPTLSVTTASPKSEIAQKKEALDSGPTPEPPRESLELSPPQPTQLAEPEPPPIGKSGGEQLIALQKEQTTTVSDQSSPVGTAKPMREKADAVSVELTDADIETLKLLLRVFRGIKDIVAALSELAGGKR